MGAAEVKRARGALQAEGTRRAKALGPGKNPRPPWLGFWCPLLEEVWLASVYPSARWRGCHKGNTKIKERGF